MSKKTTAKSSNDNRSNSLNPNNKAFKASLDNRSVQLNTKQANEKKK